MSRVRYLDVSRQPLFWEIRSLLLRSLAGKDVGDDAEATAVIGAARTDLRTNTALMVELEGRIVKLLRALDVLGFRALQFPVNVRMLGPEGSQAATRPYATDWLHCDLWSGAPRDSYNFFLYVHVSPGCPALEIFQTLPDSHPSSAFRGPYADSPLTREDLVPVGFECAAGHLAYFPSLTPHRTVRPSPPGPSGGWRMSVDFRVRLGDPYDMDQQDGDGAFTADKMNSLGVYWSYPPDGFSSLEEKLDHELRVAREKGNDAVRRRLAYLAKHFPEAKVR